MFAPDDDDDNKEKKPAFDPEMFKKMLYQSYGAYKIMGQMEFLPVDPDAKEPETKRIETSPELTEFSNFCYKYGGICSLLYEDPSMHSGGMIFKSEEERLEVCTIGEQALREEIDKFPIKEYAEALEKYQNYVKRIAEKNPHVVRNYRKF